MMMSEAGEETKALAPSDDDIAMLRRYVVVLERELASSGVAGGQLENLRRMAREGVIAMPGGAAAATKRAGMLGTKESATVAKLLGLKADTKELTVRQFEAIHQYYSHLKVEIRYKELRYTAKVDANKPRIETIGNATPCGKLVRAMKKKAPKMVEVDILSKLQGVLQPGTTTLVVGPPGCGKSSFLKAISGRLTPAMRGGAMLTGSLTYNGVPIYDEKKAHNGVFVASKVAAFIGQIDDHAPSLSVADTFRFARAMLGARKSIQASVTATSPMQEGVELGTVNASPPKAARTTPGDDDAARELQVANTLEVLGLAHVAKTIVGNAQLRGVSGGQRRRVTVGEMLFGRARVLCGDEISTGLDSKTTFEIVQALAMLTKAIKTTTVIALLQPPPEVFRTFDDVILLDSGRLAYHGPTNQILEYFATAGFKAPDRKDVADFLVEVTTAEGQNYATTDDARHCRNADDFTALFEASSHADHLREKMERDDAEASSSFEWSEFYAKEFTEPLQYYVYWNIWRRYREILGAPSLIQARILQAAAVGIVVGTLYYDLGYHEYESKFGLIFTIAVYLALGSLSSIPNLLERRNVFYKHRDAGFFPTFAYITASLLLEIPVLALEVSIFGTLTYWLPGLASSAFPLFLPLCFLVSFTCTCFFTMVASLFPAEAAVPTAGMAVTFFIFFSGFIVRRPKMPKPWRPVYWANPFAYAMRSLCVNEFRADRYDKYAYQIDKLGDLDPGHTDGIFFLKAYNFQYERSWISVGLLFMIGYATTCIIIQSIALTALRLDVSSNALEVDKDKDLLAVGVDGEVYERGTIAAKEEVAKQIRPSITASKAKNGFIDFEPVVFAFSDIHYTVDLPGTKNDRGEPEKLELLGGVWGFAKPTTMTALMGSSGAGKTTLLDCLAGRKTGGYIEGQITLNGHPKDQKTFTRVAGYVEQLDVHSPGATVYEAAEFSAMLRLPERVGPDQRKEFIANIITLLELDDLKGKLVGTISKGGLSFEQRKRLTMAVELAANPAIMFLDEPTSGLDSRAALVVIRAVRNVSATGRSVICTIHQPSYALFSTFDSLLLLKKGGRTVFFGELGDDCSNLISHLEKAAGALGYELPPLDPGMNPATWMLTICEQNQADFTAAYDTSDLGVANVEAVHAAQQPDDGSEPIAFESEYAVSDYAQFKIHCKRLARTYWRAPQYNIPRLMISVFIAGTCGSCYTYEVDDQSSAISRIGFFFMTSFNMGVIFCNTAIPVMADERAAFYRERASRMYKVSPYAGSFALVEFPYILFFSFIFVCVVYAIVDMNSGWDRFMWYWSFYYAYVTLLCFLGQFLVALLPNVETAQSIASTCFSMFATFGGFTINPDDIPDAWTFLYWIDPAHYVLEGQVVTQFHDDKSKIQVPGVGYLSLSRYLTSKDSHDSYWSGKYTYSHRIGDLITLCVMFGVLRFATLYCLMYVNYTTR